ncbi:hypothetical protein BO71DRAFT_394798 [Aspergillus ellipticus CBS 707.79]|uniref:Uncharacterized protein n=1 Tax=Aspergillus ellipticus CBS 707.79 TaxID=1448320 RepID=A0A319DN12_9EURO|nr:hypothetical protein BO71DRAFT_394798 [Aspergillus ellipticus CBS 707.79]
MPAIQSRPRTPSSACPYSPNTLRYPGSDNPTTQGYTPGADSLSGPDGKRIS